MAPNKSDKPVGSATEKPDYEEEGQPKPTGVNTTDAGGIDSKTQPGASDQSGVAGVSAADVERARQIVAMADAFRAPFEDENGRLPHVLKSRLDVRRGNEIWSIPAGTVVKDTQLTDEEWDHCLKEGIVAEATVSEMRAQEARDGAADSEQLARDARRESIGVKPKRGRDSQPPKGAVLHTDLDQAAATEARRVAGLAAALEGARRPMPAAPAAK